MKLVSVGQSWMISTENTRKNFSDCLVFFSFLPAFDTFLASLQPLAPVVTSLTTMTFNSCFPLTMTPVIHGSWPISYIFSQEQIPFVPVSSVFHFHLSDLARKIYSFKDSWLPTWIKPYNPPISKSLTTSANLLWPPKVTFTGPEVRIWTSLQINI